MPEGHDGRGAGGVSSNVGRGVANPTNVFLRSYKVYSPAFIGKPEVNRGNKSKYFNIYHAKIIAHYYRVSLSHPSNIGAARVESTPYPVPHDLYDLQLTNGNEDILWRSRVFR